MPAIGASGIMGIAKETTSGTYTAPVKFVPFDSEGLKWTQENVERRAIRNSPALLGIIRGDGHIEGDIEMDCTADILVWFLLASRCTYTKTGTAPSISYKFVPAPLAVPTTTISITVKRGNEISGYTGCVISSWSLSVDGGALKLKVSILGNAEQAVTTALTPTWPTSLPFGSGMYKLEIPTATQVFDADKFEFNVEDNGEAQNRIKNTLGAQFVKFGENSAEIKVDRDFETRAEFDQFKNTTSKSITFTATQGTDSISLTAPVSFIDDYEYGLSSVGDLVRASVSYKLAVDATGAPFTLTVVTSESIA